MEEYRREVKIKAIQAAKEKAAYLLGAIDESIGSVLEVQDINMDNYSDAVRPYQVNTYMAKASVAGEATVSDIDFKTIKIRAEVRTVFAIK
jgi:uncharacterized protein YggE